MNRQDLQQLADIRKNEVKVLLDNHQYSGAYYLSGYIVECALKACIAKQTQQYDFPDKKTVLDSYSHDLVKLVRVARLDAQLNEKIDNDENNYFTRYWSIVKDWTEESRYKQHTEQEASEIYQAITDPDHGVLKWLQQHY